MKKEYIVERQGRMFVLYAGLLDLAHQRGLKSISTELLQVPGEPNNRVAICKATVVLEQDGLERIFTGIGDAAPNNVAPAMQTCTIRLAETRAKARALRDAVNVGVTAFEELDAEDVSDSAPERGYALNASRSARPAAPNRTPRRAEPAPVSASRPAEGTPLAAEMRHPAASPVTEAQLEAIRSLCRRRGLEADTIAREKFEAESLTDLSQAQASELIRSLNERNGSRVAA
ncbi:MAG TPA: hypothetical protein VKT32_05230 [Chthonomonadaceae bacterium]|nr:hypothetical protein [Chthonomonadaceae bacterium]